MEWPESGVGGDMHARGVAASDSTSNSPFFGVKLDKSKMGVVVDQVVAARADYVLRVSATLLLPDLKDGQKALVLVVRFQKKIDGGDEGWLKPSRMHSVFDAIYEYCRTTHGGAGGDHGIDKEMLWYHVFGDVQEYRLREVSHGPNMRKLVKGYPVLIMSCCMPVGFFPVDTVDNVHTKIERAAHQLSDLLRSEFFRDIYCEVIRRESGRAYDIVKDPSFSVWKALREHHLEVSYEESLDSFFMDEDIDEMLVRMFPGKDVNQYVYKRVGYSGAVPSEQSALKSNDICGSDEG
jgi:hypothetical protein